MKLCKDCKYSRPAQVCFRPRDSVSVYDGSPVERPCEIERKSWVRFDCGPDAIHFESRKVISSFLQEILRAVMIK